MAPPQGQEKYNTCNHFLKNYKLKVTFILEREQIQEVKADM